MPTSNTSWLRRQRNRVFVQLSPRAWPDAGLSPTNRVIAVLIMVALASAVLESEPLIYEGREAWFTALEVTLGTLFLVEYAARVWCAPDGAPDLPAWRARLRFMRSPAGVLDLLALVPLFIMAIGPEAFVLRLARMLRILRLARLGRYSGAWTLMLDAVASRKHELVVGIMVAALLLLGASTVLYVVEGEAQPDAFGSIPRSMWWAIATLTTVGYGDVAPITWVGKICAGFVAVMGIGLIAIPTGILAAAFSDALQAQRARKAAKTKHRVLPKDAVD